MDLTLTAVTLGEVLAAGALQPVFQPLIDLATDEVLGYEALARGPRGSSLATPDALFAAAAAEGRLAELDWACRAAAYDAALRAGLPRELALFVNVEAPALGVPCPPHLRPVVRAAEERLRVVVELTERSLADRPADLLATVATARRHGWGIALDDVGAEPASLALQPFLHPDVVKLDMRLVQTVLGPQDAALVHAVRAYAEWSGAVVLAEGIETREHLLRAKTLGATVGQGWLYGRPGPLPRSFPVPSRQLPRLAAPPTEDTSTPYGIVSAVRDTSRSTKQLLLPMSHFLEDAAYASQDSAVLLGCFQDAKHFTPRTRVRYARHGERYMLVAALGIDLPSEPMPGVRGAALRPDDPLAGEWSVVAVSPHFAGALVAADLGDDGPESDRRFDYCITHDRDLVIAAARSLLARVQPVSVVPSPRYV